MYAEIKSKINCMTVCEARGYDLSSSGFVRCADERTPSLKIYGDTFRCYRCCIGGDIFDLVEHMEDIDSKQSLEICANIAGVSLIRAKKIDTPKKDLVALREAFESNRFDLEWKESDFRYSHLWALYKLLCLDFGTLEAKELRQIGEPIGCKWNKRNDPFIHRIIDYLTLGYDFEETCIEWLDQNT